MKRIAFLLYVVGMITTGSARAQEDKIKKDLEKQGYKVTVQSTSASSESTVEDGSENISTPSPPKRKPVVKNKTNPKPKTGQAAKPKRTVPVYRTPADSPRYKSKKSISSKENSKIYIAERPDTGKNFVYYDHRQYHYTINHNYSSSNDGALEIVSGVVWDTGVGIAQLKDAIDTCGRLKKRWTKAKWQKPMTKFKVYTREVYDEELQISYKTDTAWIWPAFKTRTFFVYEKHLKNKCMDTIVRFDTAKRWWVPVRRYGGILLLAGGGVLLADYACKNQYWGLFASNNNSGGNNNNNGNTGNNGRDSTNYPTHKPGKEELSQNSSSQSQQQGLAAKSSAKSDVLPVKNIKQPVKTFAPVVRQQEKFDLDKFLRSLPPVKIGVAINIKTWEVSSSFSICGVGLPVSKI